MGPAINSIWHCGWARHLNDDTRYKEWFLTPFIVDDILLTFDEDRSRAALRCLAELGRSNTGKCSFLPTILGFAELAGEWQRVLRANPNSALALTTREQERARECVGHTTYSWDSMSRA